jgi:hypothetical protein
MIKVDLKNMTIRKEFVNEIINTMEELSKKAETNGEYKLLCKMMKTMRKSLQWNEEIRQKGRIQND